MSVEKNPVSHVEVKRLATDQRVIEIDGARYAENVRRIGGNGFVSIDQFDRLPDHKKVTRNALAFNSGFDNPIGKWAGASVHHRDLIGVQFDQGIVDEKTGKGCHQVFNGGYDTTVTADYRRQTGVHDAVELGCNAGSPGQIHSYKPYSMVNRRRFNRQVDRFP
jgi:hypothetical protein